MSARCKREPEDSESVVYIDHDSVGSIIVRDGQVIATTADGVELGTFKTDKEAMAAIIAAKRAGPTLLAA
jgi:hypothetical protein